jgi:riboflavin synthase
MFTGIIQALGQVAAVERRSGDVRLKITASDLPWGDVALGDSIATNGVPLQN